MKKLIILFISVTLGITYLGCNKTNTDGPAKTYDFLTVSNDFMLSYLVHSEAFFLINEVLLTMDDSLQVYPDGNWQWDSTAMITIDPPDTINYPKTIVIDYGDARALDSISGKISGALSGKYLEENTRFVYSFDDYIIDGHKVFATDSLTNNGTTSGEVSFLHSMSQTYIVLDWGQKGNDTILFDAIQRINYNLDEQKIMIHEGSASGEATDSLKFFVDVNPDYPLIKDFDCEFFRDGIFNYIVKEYDNSVIGNGIIDFWFVKGECEKYAIIIVDGEDYRVELQFIMD